MSNFISTDICFSNTKQMLKSFEGAGLIYDSDLFRWTKWVINRIGILQLVEKELVLEVENYKTKLPEDFNMLWVLHKCYSCNESGVSTYRYYPHKEQRVIYKDWVNEACYSKCSAYRNDTQYEVTRTIEIEEKRFVTESFKNRTLLKLNKRVSKGKCHNECPNYYCDSPYEFNMDDDYLYFNFCEGYVHLQYYANPIDEEGYPLILDNEYIKQAVEDYLIFKSFQSMYYNGEADLERRLMYSETQHQKSLKEALNDAKLPSFKRLLEYAQESPKSLEIFNIPDGRHSINCTYPRSKFRY